MVSPAPHRPGSFVWKATTAHLHRLRELLAAAITRPGARDWYDIPAAVRKLDPGGARAVVGYGSWYAGELRKSTSFADVYLVLDDYSRFYGNAFHAWMNRVLPPNVYFIWADHDGKRTIRGKYNVISAADLERECSPALRDVYTAGRLTKLVWIAWVRDEPTRDWLLTRLVEAHCTLTPIVLSLLPDCFSYDQFSLELLAFSYRAEARLEGWEHVRALHAAHGAHYRELHGVLLESFASATGLLDLGATGVRKRASPQWRTLTRVQRGLLRRSRRRGYLRWPRIILTEPNLADLAANEAERKAGVHVRVTPRLRRHPLIFGLPEFLRVLHERNTQERIRKSQRSRPARQPNDAPNRSHVHSRPDPED
ncbi:MAG: hypothetical protein ACE5I7_01205 [Candidatus Binatia bacterium]